MLVNIVKQDIVDMQEYWVIRGVKEDKKVKKVVVEVEFYNKPETSDIALFLLENKDRVDFCSVEHNYRLAEKNVFGF